MTRSGSDVGMTNTPITPDEHLAALSRYRDAMRAVAQDLLHNDWVTAQEHTDVAEHLYEVMERALLARGH